MIFDVIGDLVASHPTITKRNISGWLDGEFDSKGAA
jgi:hypothetical protein